MNSPEQMNMYSTHVTCNTGTRRLLGALLLVLAAKSEDLSKITYFRAVVTLHKAIIGEVDPGLAVQGGELFGHGSHDSTGHTAMWHYRYHTGKLRTLHPFYSPTDAEDCFTSASRREPVTCLCQQLFRCGLSPIN